MRHCAFCDAELVIHGRGQGQKTFCNVACRNAHAKIARSKRQFDRTCSAHGCDKPATRVGADLCETHYYRIRRNGILGLVGYAKPGVIHHSHGYVLAEAKGHPMALGGYRAYEHRVVFYDAHGAGPFNCHWCAIPVSWDDMHVDHVDGCKDHNELGNLVASCALCNQGRGRDPQAISPLFRQLGLPIKLDAMLSSQGAKHFFPTSTLIA